IGWLITLFSYGQQPIKSSVKQVVEEIEVSGTVTDAADGKPLPGVSVVARELTGTITDINGKYVFNVPVYAVLKFSYYDMNTQEIPVRNKRVINVSMEKREIPQVKMAKINNEHLEPSDGIFDGSAYHSKVRQILFNGLTDAPEIRLLVMPAFTPENVLDIEYDENKNKYYLKYHICDKNVWYNKNSHKIKVFKYKTEIDKESVELIKSLIETAVDQARFPPQPGEDDEIVVKADGVRYYFTGKNHGLKTGVTHSPAKGTLMERLVDIGNQLIELAKSGKKITKLDDNLYRKIENLTEELKL
ncbi:MAG: carboxypeptidase-like regulatory domain-containing protein, partial [Tannerella sp.]|nr:carboxypeptidase-like regulatory domain-containing protein [Tannerella sp.]